MFTPSSGMVVQARRPARRLAFPVGSVAGYPPARPDAATGQDGAIAGAVDTIKALPYLGSGPLLVVEGLPAFVGLSVTKIPAGFLFPPFARVWGALASAGFDTAPPVRYLWARAATGASRHVNTLGETTVAGSTRFLDAATPASAASLTAPPLVVSFDRAGLSEALSADEGNGSRRVGSFPPNPPSIPFLYPVRPSPSIQARRSGPIPAVDAGASMG